ANESQQVTAVAENGVLFIRSLPQGRIEGFVAPIISARIAGWELDRTARNQINYAGQICLHCWDAQSAQHSPIQASWAFLTSSQTIASEPTLSIHQNPNSACAARLTTATQDSHPQVIASMASARSARLPSFSARSSLLRAR